MKAAKRSKTQKKERVRAKSGWQERKTKEKEQKKFLEEEIVDASFESNINTVAEKHLFRNYTC